ncbi:MAG: IS5 family transposase [Acidobacteria bacterium]|jgi:transposase|nr:IS5 family transposase [Acidobacteriota bacterium]
MRGDDQQQAGMFSYISPEQRVPADHPLRPIRKMTDEIFKQLSPRFAGLYARVGRPSIAPEKLLRALLLQVLYSVRSERMLMEQLSYNMLFRWFVGLNMDDVVWDATTFSKNRDRLLAGEIAEEFFAAVLDLAREKEFLSDEHFTVDGTLVEGWASLKSFQPKDDAGRDNNDKPDDPGNPTVNFHGQKRSNNTHQSTTDADLRLYKKTKGSEAKLAYQGHVLMENRNGLVVNATLTQATGIAEREAALAMIASRPQRKRVTLAGDKAYDTKDFVADLRAAKVTPHVAQNNKRRKSAIDERTTRHPGYEVSQRKRKRVEEIFGWLKTVGLLRKTRHRGLELVGWIFKFATAAYNLVRIRNLALVT